MLLALVLVLLRLKLLLLPPGEPQLTRISPPTARHTASALKMHIPAFLDDFEPYQRYLAQGKEGVLRLPKLEMVSQPLTLPLP